MPAPTLMTTIHDPQARLLDQLRRHGRSLEVYGGVFAAATEPTAPAVIDALCEHGAHVTCLPIGVPGQAQRLVLECALAHGASEGLLCDFDRWLHWIDAWPDELSQLPNRIAREHPEAWYCCLGRTERAFATHPQTQILPETATNRALAALLGRSIDATAGAAWIRRPAAEVILASSIEATKATDLEWPALVARTELDRVQGLFLEGLEFETPDAYRAEIAEAGSLDAWIAATYDRPAIMRERLQLAADSIAALIRVQSDRSTYR